MDIEIRVPTATTSTRSSMSGPRRSGSRSPTASAGRRSSTRLGCSPPSSGRRSSARSGVIAMGQWFGGRPVPMGGIASVVVLPEHRGQGVAGRLLEAAIERMRERGLRGEHAAPGDDPGRPRGGWEIAGDLASYRIPTRSLERLPRGRSEDLRRLTAADWPAVRGADDDVARPALGLGGPARLALDLFAKEDFADQSFVYGIDGEDGPRRLPGVRAEGERPVGLRDRGRGDHRAGSSAAIHSCALPRRPRDAGRPRRRAGRADRRAARSSFPSRTSRSPATTGGCTGSSMRRPRSPPAATRRMSPPRSTWACIDRLSPWNEGSWVLRVDGGRGELVAGGHRAGAALDQRVQRAVDGLGVDHGAPRRRRAPPR